MKQRDVITISFKYYSSQLKRAERIFKNFGGQTFHIWYEGFKEILQELMEAEMDAALGYKKIRKVILLPTTNEMAIPQKL